MEEKVSGGTSDIIIIPDVHGRDFWRQAVNGLDRDTHVVFLGDYMDPYGDEWIYWSDAFQGLQDIIAFKKAHPEQVTLLYGNHDLHYLFPSLKGSRFNMYQASLLKRVFTENADAFQMAFEHQVDGRRFLFTHAGVNRRWLENHPDLFGNPDEVSADTFNRLSFTEEFVEALADVSAWRGGSARAGSMIWADTHEFEGRDATLPGITQIFGHTRLPRGPKIMDGACCLDCQRAFYLDGEGDLPQ